MLLMSYTRKIIIIIIIIIIIHTNETNVRRRIPKSHKERIKDKVKWKKYDECYKYLGDPSIDF